MLFSVQDLHVSYGSIKAVHGVSFEVDEGEIVTLIGANGAGKSTILNTIAGLHRPDQGEIIYGGANLVRMNPHDVVKLGVALVPEGRRIFGNLTVYENLRLAGFQVNRDDMEKRIKRCMATSRAWRSAAISLAIPSPAASSRCWPWAGRW